MQPWLATIIASAVAVLINLGTAAYVYGKLAQSVGAHEKRLDSHSERLEDHGQRLANVEGRLEGKLK